MAGEPLSLAERTKIDELSGVVQSGTFYELLGVPADSDPKSIQGAYYALSREWHPDRFFRREMGDYGQRLEIVFATITKAYKILTDPEKRASYDQEIASRPAPRPVASATARPSSSSSSSSSVGSVEGRPAPQRVERAPTLQALSPAAREARAKLAREKIKKKLRETVGHRMDKGRGHFEEGSALLASDPTRALNPLRLAVEFDPNNDEYREALATAEAKSKRQMFERYLADAESANAYGNNKKALHFFKKAGELDVGDSGFLFNLGRLVRRNEDDMRAQLTYFRRAVDASPDNIEYRLALAELYIEMKMNLNARREYQQVLLRDANNKDAKKGIRKVMF